MPLHTQTLEKEKFTVNLKQRYKTQLSSYTKQKASKARQHYMAFPWLIKRVENL
jgi:hypothetical protein